MARTNGATPDFLSTLGTVGAEDKPQSRAGKSAPVVVEGLEAYGVSAKMGTEIEDGFKARDGKPVKDAMFAHFIAEGLALGRCPDNYLGAEGKVSASLQLRSKDNRTKLKPEVVEQFQALNIRLFHDVRAPKTMRIKPALAADTDLLNQMLHCLHKNGFPVGDIFEKQEQVSDWIVDGKHTLNDLFAEAKKARAVKSNNQFTDAHIRQLLDQCAGVTINATFDGTYEELLAAFEKIAAVPVPKDVQRDLKAKPKAEPTVHNAEAAKADLMATLQASLAQEKAGEGPVKGNRRGRASA